MSRFLRRDLRLAVDVWVESCEASARSRRVLAAFSPEGRGLRRAFNAWGEVAASQICFQHGVQAGITWSMNRSMRTWASHAHVSSHSRLLLLRAASALTNCGERVCACAQ